MSVRDLVESWNEQFTGKLPLVEWPVSKGRTTKTAARLKEHPHVDFWSDVFTAIMCSKFLLGLLPSKNGHENWKCTFDFLVANDTNCLKIKEGQYAKS